MQIDDKGQVLLFGDNPEYDAFLGKFEAKKTTDDCYTPENVYDAVLAWVRTEYELPESTPIVRPFWPGGDFEHFDYPAGCVVVDNPPFSIRAQIIDIYQRRAIRFFLFSPALTLLTMRSGVCHIATGVSIRYENGAEVNTSFVTNLEDCTLRTAPKLYEAIEAANRANLTAVKKHVPKYTYPDYVVTAAIAQRWCRYGVEYRLQAQDCVGVGALDAQRRAGKKIFGYGYLLSERAAAERAAAERAAAERAAAEIWKLSEREKQIVSDLGKERVL